LEKINLSNLINKSMINVKQYDIYLNFDIKKLRYEGKVKIDITSDEDEIALDAVNQKIKKVSINNKEIPFEYDGNKLKIKGKISGILEVEIEKEIPRSLVGIYAIPYEDYYIISTQFEAAHAREMIPCIDHPEYKSVFKLTVNVDSEYDVISNMPYEKVEEVQGRKIYYFLPTPKMSTYLLYLGIGKFEEIKDKYRNIDVIVATPKGKISKGKFALELAKKFLEFYENYYKIPYSLPKLHLIAVPEFAFGAMENWGAITFRESALLADENSPLLQKKRVALVVAHEIAHMWFGNLVTMKWWNDLWLNESFATFMSYKAVDKVFPEWNVFYDFINAEYAPSMRKDSLTSTHSIEAKVEKPEEIEQIFDEISYGKGASILRMIEGYLTEEIFMKGIREYLNQFNYSNATGKDLWRCLSKVSGKEVEKIMEAWIKKKGYPIVNVEIKENKIKLKQSLFSFKESYKEIWPIPITLEVNGKFRSLLFENEEEYFNLGEEIKSLKLNINKNGFYRVHYDNLKPVLISNLSSFDKFGLINDYYAFFLKGMINYDEYVGIIEKFFDERDRLITNELSDQLFTLYLFNEKRFKSLAIDFHRRQLKFWEGLTDENSRMIFGILSHRLAIIDESYANEISKKFKDYDKIDPNLKLAVITGYAIANGEKAFFELLDKYRKEKFDEEKERIMFAMVFFKDPSLVLNTLSLILSGEIKKQDMLRVIATATRNLKAKREVWNWLKVHIEFIRKPYLGTGILGRMLANIIPVIGVGMEEDVKSFFERNKFEEAINGINEGLEMLDIYSRIAKL
jgi:tricorn protease interacting factor F2/3